MERTSTNDLAINGGTPVRDIFLPFGKPCLGTEEISEVVDTLKSGWIGTGPKTQEFERMFCEYIGCKYAIAVNSCTAGLHLSLIVAGVGPDDEVITSPLTFAATANVIEHCRAKPIFVDIDPETLNMDVDQISPLLGARSKVIMPVHFGGLSCDMERIIQIAEQFNLIIVEDAAHAIGTIYHGRKIGTWGKLTNFSFYPNKNMTTIEGGMITTDVDAWDEILRVYRLHGLSRDAWKRFSRKRLSMSDSVVPGFKYNMTDVQASLGLHQLSKLESFISLREQYAKIYDDEFKDIPGISKQYRPTNGLNRHSLHLYVIIIDPRAFTATRNEIIDALLAENIGAALHYRALHTHPYYRNRYHFEPTDYPNAYQVGENIFTLPMSPSMSLKDVDDVIEGVKKVLTALRR